MKRKRVGRNAPTVRVPVIGWMAARLIVGRFKRAGQLADVEAIAVHTFEQADAHVRRAASVKPGEPGQPGAPAPA